MSLAHLGRRLFLAGLASAGAALPAQAAPRATPRPSARQPAWAAAGHGMAQGRFGAVHYRWRSPGGPSSKVPVLCLHASPGSGIGFVNFLGEMGTDRLVIAPDNPGFGLSDRPPTPSTIEGFAGAMGDLLDALGLTRVDLVGSHTGSATAVELARQRPRAVRRIVLHSALMFTPQEIADYRARLAGTIPETLDAAAERLPDLWGKFARIRQELDDDAAWQLFWEMNRDPLHNGWGHEASFAYDFPSAIRKVTQPILVLNPQEGLHPVTARVRGLAANIALTELPWTQGVFSAHAGEVAALARAHFGG